MSEHFESKKRVLLQETLYLDGSTVFLFAGLRIASRMKASVLTSRTEQKKGV